MKYCCRTKTAPEKKHELKSPGDAFLEIEPVEVRDVRVQPVGGEDDVFLLNLLNVVGDVVEHLDCDLERNTKSLKRLPVSKTWLFFQMQRISRVCNLIISCNQTDSFSSTALYTSLHLTLYA